MLYLCSCLTDLSLPPGGDWTPHKVELTVWSFFVLRENKPQVLDDLPSAEAEVVRPARENGLHQEVSNADLQAEAGEESVASEPASNGSPEPETCTGQQPLETPGAESPAQQTEVRCFTFIINIIIFFIIFFFFFFLILIFLPSFLPIHQEVFHQREDILASSLSFCRTDPILEIFSKIQSNPTFTLPGETVVHISTEKYFLLSPRPLALDLRTDCYYFQTPVVETPVESHNGNGHTEHLEEKEEAAAPEAAQTKRTLEDPEPAAAAPESKRPCTESVEREEREEREETEPAQPPPAAPAAPNGVNSTQPQPISSGGD